MFRAACAERETNPCAFIDPFKALTDLGKVAPPATRLAAFESDADADQALSFALEGELYAVGFQLLHAREQPKLVCEHFREVLEQLDSAVSMAKTYYGLEL
jgi:hypothetical protein